MHDRLIKHFDITVPAESATVRLTNDLAHAIVATVRETAERTVALRKLMEFKDALVRAEAE